MSIVATRASCNDPDIRCEADQVLGDSPASPRSAACTGTHRHQPCHHVSHGPRASWITLDHFLNYPVTLELFSCSLRVITDEKEVVVVMVME